ncbi:fibronectin type III domain-containing protein, partial [bacterium]|nr:fibronectin type III domain-containing protein [bacterium]
MGKKRLFLYIILSLVFSFFYTVYASEVNLIKNPDLSVMKGDSPEHWRLGGQTKFYYDEKEKAAVITTMKTYDSFTQGVSLAPGHYLLKALIKTNTNATSLTCIASLSISASDKYRWVEIPFYVDGLGERNLSVAIGIRRIYNDPTTHKGETRIKEMQLIRLGDTFLPRNWATKISVHPLHKLKTINDNPNWNRPGKVIFNDTLIGTEIWLMSQYGQTDLSYVGFPDFSNNGKYVQVGNRKPGYVMRTDGSHRYGSPSKAWPNRLLWLFPWEEKNLPEKSDPSDWIVTLRTRRSNLPIRVEMLNLVTGETKKIVLPTIPEWDIALVPSTPCGRGQDTKRITHNTLVWIAKDKKKIGLSSTEGKNFRSFEIKSISKKPENDTVNPGVSAAWGKGGDNWYNSVDKNDNRYFAFELNKEKDFKDPENPYQVWMLPLSEKDTRGLLRVIPNPKVEITPGSYSRGRLLWWDLTAGLPPFGDSATFLLEDGTLIYMCSLGEHSGFGSTISTLCPYTNQAQFIGNYPKMDRVSWPHEFKHNKDFAIVEAFTEPFCPVVMADLRYNTLWSLVITNFHDYAARYAQRPMYSDRPGFGTYHKPMIRTAPTQSPDFTKVLYCSSMLTGDDPERLLGDAYIAVARYPQPPINVRFEGIRLVWDKPQYNAEIMGYNIYYSKESGKGSWTKLNPKPIREM